MAMGSREAGGDRDHPRRRRRSHYFPSAPPLDSVHFPRTRSSFRPGTRQRCSRRPCEGVEPRSSRPRARRRASSGSAGRATRSRRATSRMLALRSLDRAAPACSRGRFDPLPPSPVRAIVPAGSLGPSHWCGRPPANGRARGRLLQNRECSAADEEPTSSAAAAYLRRLRRARCLASSISASTRASRSSTVDGIARARQARRGGDTHTCTPSQWRYYE